MWLLCHSFLSVRIFPKEIDSNVTGLGYMCLKYVLPLIPTGLKQLFFSNSKINKNGLESELISFCCCEKKKNYFTDESK